MTSNDAKHLKGNAVDTYLDTVCSANSNTHNHSLTHQIKSKHSHTNHPHCHRSQQNAPQGVPMESVLRFSLKALKENFTLAHLIQLTRPPLVSWSSSSSEEASDLCSMIDKVFDLDNKVKTCKTGFRIRIRMFLPCPDPDPGKKVRK